MNPFNDVVRILIGAPVSRCRAYIRLMGMCRRNNLLWIARFLSRRLQAYGIYISPKANLAPTVDFPHPTGIVIGEGVTVGEDVRIYQSVTLGGGRIGDWKTANYPTIERGTVLFAGVVVVGKVSVGENCVIGANSVVVTDLPRCCTCVGAPARVVRQHAVKVI